MLGINFGSVIESINESIKGIGAQISEAASAAASAAFQLGDRASEIIPDIENGLRQV